MKQEIRTLQSNKNQMTFTISSLNEKIKELEGEIVQNGHSQENSNKNIQDL